MISLFIIYAAIGLVVAGLAVRMFVQQSRFEKETHALPVRPAHGGAQR